MLLLANGDSNTYGYGLSDQQTDPTQWPTNQEDQLYALQHSWPAQLAKEIDHGYVNLARPGGSNDRIVRTTLQYLTKHGHDNTIVIIGWTDPTRREVHVEDHVAQSFPNEEPTGYKIFTADHDEFKSSMQHNPNAYRWSEKYRHYGWDLVESHVRFYSQIILMQSYLEQHKIPHLFFTVTAVHEYMKKIQKDKDSSYAVRMTGDLYESINWHSFAGHNSYNKQTIDHWLFRQLIHSNIPNEHLDATNHPTQEGHRVIAAKLLDELKKRKIA